jgi:hypothetical protein
LQLILDQKLAALFEILELPANAEGFDPWYREISILKKNFQESQMQTVYRLRANRRQVPLPDKGTGDGVTTPLRACCVELVAACWPSKCC